MDIETEEVDIETEKVDIGKILEAMDGAVRDKTAMYMVTLFEKCGNDIIFGRSTVEQITGLKSSRASKIINMMLEKGLIVSVRGHGKGKYRFK